jgi:hypothetical protein
MQGNQMGQEQNQGMNSGQGFAADGMNWGNTQDQAPAEPKFRGCSTLPLDMNAKKPIDKPPADHKQAPDDVPGPDNGQAPDKEHGPWAFAGQDDRNKGPGAHPADADRRHGMRSIRPDLPPKEDHKKMPPMKSIMDYWHKPMPRPLMGDHFPEMPPMKSIMDHMG